MAPCSFTTQVDAQRTIRSEDKRPEWKWLNGAMMAPSPYPPVSRSLSDWWNGIEIGRFLERSSIHLHRSSWAIMEWTSIHYPLYCCSIASQIELETRRNGGSIVREMRTDRVGNGAGLFNGDMMTSSVRKRLICSYSWAKCAPNAVKIWWNENMGLETGQGVGILRGAQGCCL